MRWISKISFLILFLCLLPQVSFAGNAADILKGNNAADILKSGTTATGEKTGLSTTSIEVLVGNFIKAFLSIVGIILVVIIVYAGYLWLTAGGNEEQVGQAKAYLKNAIIGLIITMSAYGITSFVIGSILTATST